MNTSTAKHVLFDLDGTLVDTRAAVEACYRTVFEKHGDAPFSPADLPADLFAMRPREVFAIVAPDRVDELYAAYQDAYPDCVDHVGVFPGVAELITALRAAGRVPSLVTNKGLARTHIDLAVAGIAPDRFAVIVTAEDTPERKPHPAPILTGLQRAGADAAQAIYVGDGPQDILAARAAGMDCIAVSYGFYDREKLAALNPAAIVDNILELSRALSLDMAEGSATHA